VMQDPEQARTLFPEFFGVSFDGAVRDFQGRVRTPGGIPPLQ
jgi:hypothetical protein